ncbi:hypothetical protein FA09DRAFT_215076 [Tilletiopsis washingtonensis]|uniref:Uncharacterized protein n=1 Tax=Tilletiopsis washingtonensis TaxID=58919 RepID=A0A316ZHC4_9BASI|nr:hypothetical protein FA09DRAFT_215076 [Tilletiopsis washingtonensis]PWN99675.1 hypothetical protein FA09DRAFT_215076 [Tilletiopsis washingtonensis]
MPLPSLFGQRSCAATPRLFAPPLRSSSSALQLRARSLKVLPLCSPLHLDSTLQHASVIVPSQLASPIAFSITRPHPHLSLGHVIITTPLSCPFRSHVLPLAATPLASHASSTSACLIHPHSIDSTHPYERHAPASSPSPLRRNVHRPSSVSRASEGDR